MAVLPQRVKNWFEGLRFPVLVLLAGALFLVNVFIPDVLPFVDEALLALLAILLSRLKRRPSGEEAKQDSGAEVPGRTEE